MPRAPLNAERNRLFCRTMIFHFQWHLPLTLPSPRAGASKAGATRGERDKGEGTCTFYATLGLPWDVTASARGLATHNGRASRFPMPDFTISRSGTLGRLHF